MEELCELELINILTGGVTGLERLQCELCGINKPITRLGVLSHSTVTPLDPWSWEHEHQHLPPVMEHWDISTLHCMAAAGQL